MKVKVVPCTLGIVQFSYSVLDKAGVPSSYVERSRNIRFCDKLRKIKADKEPHDHEVELVTNH